jgi:uncharacterized protein YjiS (DUF1127 family)
MTESGGHMSGFARRIGDGGPAVPDVAASPSEVRTWWPYPPLVRWAKRRHERAHDRRLLASLDDRTLRDIGLDRASVDRESTTSFWRLR